VQSESSRVGWPEHPATGNGWSTGQPATAERAHYLRRRTIVLSIMAAAYTAGGLALLFGTPAPSSDPVVLVGFCLVLTVTGSGIATIAIPIVFRTWAGRANDPTELRRRFGRCLFGFAIPLLVLAMCYLAAIVFMAAIMML
jgi:hypothetical protein